MNKIGIITVYQNTNYGSKLQSYAMQHFLKSIGYSAENIPFIKMVKNEVNLLARILNFFVFALKKPSIFLTIFARKKCNKRNNIFVDYTHNHINESIYTVRQIREKINEQNNPYYKYICGSDQIWAPNQFNENYFLSFIGDNSTKIAYAPSIGLPQVPFELVDKYKILINNIKFVSIREKDGANIIKKITGRDVPVVVDPTLLLTKDDWKKHMIEPKIRSPYILCYFLGNNKCHRRWVEKLSKKTGYKVIVLPFATRDYYWGDEKIFEAGPREFLGLINDAKIVCTDSYHGMLFSINLNKEFYVFLRFKSNDKINQNSRVLNFLEIINLQNKIVDLNSENIFEKIDWMNVNDLIDNERTKSIKYLKKALGWESLI